MARCLDTSAWLEYFNGTAAGRKVRRILHKEPEVLTPAVVAAQVVEAARLRGGNSRQFLEFLQSKSEVVPVSPEIARLAGKINASHAHPPGDWTLIESLVLATARHRNAQLVTLDPIFGGRGAVELLGP